MMTFSWVVLLVGVLLSLRCLVTTSPDALLGALLTVMLGICLVTASSLGYILR